MLLGCIADDFTGASDLANTLAKGGMSTTQFVGIPDTDAASSCEAGVVALKTRSTSARSALSESLEALDWLKKQGCRQYLFKYCSTFDSTPSGNIGPVAEALRAALDAPVAVVCPAFPATGRSLFMGHLFVHDRLLNESGMEDHPLNPMTDPDIRRWLARQCSADVGLVRLPTVRAGSAAVRAALDLEAEGGRRLVVVDATEDSDLITIDRAIAHHSLVTGGSGIALGLPENFRSAGLLADMPSNFSPIAGPGVALSGSCSAASQAQVTAHLRSHPGFAVEPTDLLEGRIDVADALRFAAANRDALPIIYSTADSRRVKDVQSRYGRERSADAVEGFFSTLALELVKSGVVRIVVGGGETSGAVVGALGLTQLRIGPEIDPGVPALSAEGHHPLRLALKSGNFGAVDFFQKALEKLGRQ